MADSKRQQIFDAVLTRFKAILTSGGYETNLGQQVFAWRDLESKPFETTELPAINVRDVKQTSSNATIGVTQHEHALEIWADIFTVAAVIDQQVRKLQADVVKAIGADRKWSGLAFDTEPASDEMDIQHSGKVSGGSRVKFIIKYRTRPFDPYQ